MERLVTYAGVVAGDEKDGRADEDGHRVASATQRVGAPHGLVLAPGCPLQSSDEGLEATGAQEEVEAPAGGAEGALPPGMEDAALPLTLDLVSPSSDWGDRVMEEEVLKQQAQTTAVPPGTGLGTVWEAVASMLKDLGKTHQHPLLEQQGTGSDGRWPEDRRAED